MSKDLAELIERVKWASEIRRLAGCGDIPRYRRRQLMRLAHEIGPQAFPTPHADPEPFADGYYRRPGLRMKARPTEASSASSPILLLQSKGAS